MRAEADMDLARAEQLVHKSLSGSPENADFLDSLAWVLFRQGRLRTAARAIEEALDIDGDVRDPIKLDHAGDIFMALDDTDRAAVYWNQALDAAIDEDMNIQRKLQRPMSPER
jgi:Tfp pilus assembly protein PilF